MIQVDDRLERRIRKPVDALRCVVSCAWIVVLAVAAVAASAATTGVETDIVGASGQLPSALLTVAQPIALYALLILPLGLAVSQLVRRQVRRLIEAVATGLVAGAAAQVVNIALPRPAGTRLYYAIIMSHPGVTHVNALDPYLAGLVAYVTMIGLTGRPGWRNALGLAIGVYAVVQLAALDTTGLSILLTLLAGRAIGLAVRYAAGSASQRPTALAIATALSAGGLAVTAIRRVSQSRAGAAGSRYYAVTTEDGSPLDVVVFDRDQQAAGTFYRLYRWIRVPGQVARTAPLSLDRTVERRALLSYAAKDAGVPTPRLRTLIRVGADAAVLAYEHCEGITLARTNPGCTDEELGRVWDTVTRLHENHVTHRALTADRIMFTPDEPGHAARPGRRRRGSERPADTPGPCPAHRRARAVRGTGEVGAARDREGGRRTSWWPCCRCCSRSCSSAPPGTRCAAAATSCPPSARRCSRRCPRARSCRCSWSGSGRAPW